MKKNKLIKEGYRKLKNIFERMFGQKKKHIPSLVLQPVRQNNLRGTDPY